MSKIELNLSDDLAEKLKQRASAIGMDSVEEYLMLLISEVLEDDEEHGPDISEGKEEEIRKQLEGLGYM